VRKRRTTAQLLRESVQNQRATVAFVEAVGAELNADAPKGEV
jgi:hypothetical protein